MELVLEARTAHKDNTIESKGREIRLRGAASMNRDDMEFMQAVRVVADGANVKAKADGTLKISGATEVILYVAGYTDYLPKYPEFKGRDYEGDTLRALDQAEKLGYTALKRNHVSDVQSLMQRVQLDLGVAPSGLPTDRLVKEGDPREVHQLYFEYARYLQICSSRFEWVPVTDSEVHRNIIVSHPEGGKAYNERLRGKDKGGRPTPKLVDTDMDSNLYYHPTDPHWVDEHLYKMRAVGKEKASRFGDPLFVDPADGDFSFRPDSPALALGIELLDVSKMGRRDMGAK